MKSIRVISHGIIVTPGGVIHIIDVEVREIKGDGTDQHKDKDEFKEHEKVWKDLNEFNRFFR